MSNFTRLSCKIHNERSCELGMAVDKIMDKMISKINKKAQEEMVGFAVIVIIVAVIMLFLLVFYLRSPQKESIESYEANSFLQSTLHYTTECEDYFGAMDVQKVIFECSRNPESQCLNGQNLCEVLESTLKSLAAASWPVGSNRPVKGYEMKITSDFGEIISFREGNVTGSYKGAFQSLPPKYGEDINITFRAYY